MDVFGIDPDGPVPEPEPEPGNADTLNWIDVENPLSEEDFTQLQQQINPLQEDDMYGISIYISSCLFASARVQH